MIIPLATFVANESFTNKIVEKVTNKTLMVTHK